MMSRREMMKAAAASGLVSMSMRAAGSDDEVAAAPAPSARVSRFEGLAFGMFVHWGLYSQIGRGEWAKHMQGIPTAEYMRLMETFTAADFDGRSYARLARRAGMRYITLTSRHHDGFSLYDTGGLSPYDVTHTPAGRDLVRDFVDGCRAEGIVPMLYCTTLDWSDPRFDADFDAYLRYLRDSVEILCTRYGSIGGFWFDGNWSRKDADWREDELYALIRRHQPEAMIINNTGIDAMGRAGHPEIDSVTFERGRPSTLDRRGAPKYVSGEMCHTMNFHWGKATRDFNFLSPAHVIESLCLCRRAGANLLMNLGPEAQGGLPAYESAAFGVVGAWIEGIGGASSSLYRGRPGVTGDGEDFGLSTDDGVDLYVFDLTATANTDVHGPARRGPGRRTFRGVTGEIRDVRWFDNDESLTFTRTDDGSLAIEATGYPYGTNTVVRVARARR
ncbi:MAG: alpha-L-fucosidase [Phycisphaerales bacterium]|nr:alpha-L-fucosidase [Phycisphaerales bacterium]